MHKPLLLLISAGCFISCHKEASNPDTNFTWFGTQNPAVYNYVLINANEVLNKSDSDELFIGVSAAFLDSTSHRIASVNTLTVNDVVIQPGRDSTYSYDYSPNKGFSFFGSRVLVTIRGVSSIDTVSSAVYVPKQLAGQTATYPDTVSITGGIDLSWATDDENTWGHVVIQLFYYEAISVAGDSSLPDKIATVSITVPDNGNYHLSEADLKTFPKNAFVGITIARGTQNEAILPVSRRKIYYFSSSSVSTPPVKLTR